MLFTDLIISLSCIRGSLVAPPAGDIICPYRSSRSCRQEWMSSPLAVEDLGGDIGNKDILLLGQTVVRYELYHVHVYSKMNVWGQLAEWLRHWTLNHEIVGSSPAVRLVFCT